MLTSPDDTDIPQVHKHHNQDEAIHIVSTELLSNAAATSGALPSLEFTAIILALQMCSQISLYGFFAAERHGARFHYYDVTPAPPSPVSQASHNINANYGCATICEARSGQVRVSLLSARHPVPKLHPKQLVERRRNAGGALRARSSFVRHRQLYVDGRLPVCKRR